MTLRDMITEYVGRMDDDATYWTDAICISYANKAVADIIKRLKVKFSAYVTFDTVADQQRYVVPVDYIANDVLYFDSSHDSKITFVTSPSKIYGTISSPTSTGTPAKAFIWSLDGVPRLWLYPIPNDAYTLEWFYWRRPKSLSGDNDEPMVPREIHSSIVDLMELQGQYKDKEISLPAYKTLYEAELQKIGESELIKQFIGQSIKVGSGAKHFPSQKSSVGVKLADPSGSIVWGNS